MKVICIKLTNKYGNYHFLTWEIAASLPHSPSKKINIFTSLPEMPTVLNKCAKLN